MDYKIIVDVNGLTGQRVLRHVWASESSDKVIGRSSVIVGLHNTRPTSIVRHIVGLFMSFDSVEL